MCCHALVVYGDEAEERTPMSDSIDCNPYNREHKLQSSRWAMALIIL